MNIPNSLDWLTWPQMSPQEFRGLNKCLTHLKINPLIIYIFFINHYCYIVSAISAIYCVRARSSNDLDMIIVVYRLSFLFQLVPSTLVRSQCFLNILPHHPLAVWQPRLNLTEDSRVTYSEKSAL